MGTGLRAVAIAVLISATLAVAGPADGAAPATCFGQPITIKAKAGSVTLGTAGADVIQGTPGNDVIRARGGADLVCSLGGNDRVFGGGGNDKINLGGGADEASGGGGADIIHGKNGADDIFGNGGSDQLIGGGGGDFLSGGKKGDRLLGNGGNDVLRGDGGSDICDGGNGADSLVSCNEQDVALIVTTAASLDGVIGTPAGPAALAAASFPLGAWTAADLFCFNVLFGQISKASVRPSPGWRIPQAGQPGAGMIPTGRVYEFNHSTKFLAKSHATVIGGKAYFFPSGC